MEKGKMKKVLAILLVILFVVSLTAVAVEAHGGGGHHGILDMIIPVASARGHHGGSG
jgi:hypothetical protein